MSSVVYCLCTFDPALTPEKTKNKKVNASERTFYVQLHVKNILISTGINQCYITTMPGLVKNSMKIVPGYEENALVN
jgi:hypothetical protein